MEAPSITPSLLIQRASFVKERAMRYEDLRRLADKRRQFEIQLDTFRIPTQTIELINQVRQQLAAEGIPLHPLVPTDALREDLQTFAEDFRNDPSVLIDPRHASRRKELLKRLESLVEDRTSKTATDWREYVLELIPPIHGDVLDVLSRVAAFRDAAATVRREINNLKASAEQLPSSTDEIKAVQLEAEHIRDAWTALGGEGLPDEVLAFLREAGATGAPLERLTSTVRKWLGQHNLEAGFVITMRSTVPSGRDR